MSQGIIEYWREQVVSDLFKSDSFNKLWPIWAPQIKAVMTPLTGRRAFNAGDELYNIFKSSGIHREDGSQGDLSASGTAWEALVCWYLNFNLIGRRTIVIKHKDKFIPKAISDAITVKYGTAKSNTESDLIGITFPDELIFGLDKDNIKITDENGKNVELYKTKRSKYNLKGVIDAIADIYFQEIEVHVIQCKTNWNDNAQVPMLWDMIYSASSFSSAKISVGQAQRLIAYAKKFSYSFVTVPTVQVSKIKPTSLCVLRVSNLSGGNYWGLPSSSGVADNVKEMLTKNLLSGHSSLIENTFNQEVKRSDYSIAYGYFKL